MPSFRLVALFVVVSSLYDKNNRWIASAGSLRGDNKNDNTDVDVDIDVDEELSSSRQLASAFDQNQNHNFDMNHNNAHVGHNGYAFKGNSNNKVGLPGSYGHSFTGSYDNGFGGSNGESYGGNYGEGYGGNYGEGYGGNYGNPLPQPYGNNNNGYGGNYGNPIHQSFDMNHGSNNNGGYVGNYANPIPGPYDMIHGSSNNYGYGSNGAPQLQEDARVLYALMMQYRNSVGKPSVPISVGLTRVAEVHCEDLFAKHYPVRGRNTTPNGCNTHSWYNPPNGATPCCYTADHNQAKCMWDKPKQLSSYQGNGYEIAHGPLSAANPTIWLDDWKHSPGHNDVIVENPPFSSFHAVGVACCGTPERQFAVTWFGTEYDPHSNSY